MTRNMAGFDAMQSAAAIEERETKRNFACIVCLMGIPGVGKTTFSLELCAFLKNSFPLCDVISVTYDEILGSKEKELIDCDDMKDVTFSLWKNQRILLLKAVDSLLKDFYQKEMNELQENNHKNVLNIRRKILELNEINGWKPKMKLAIIIDDNLYYKSMRYDYFQMARANKCSFCEIYLNCDLDTALMRNEQRSCGVSRKTIIEMAEKIEPPDPLKNRWEENSIIINMSELSELRLDESIKLIEQAFENPVEAFEADLNEERQLSRNVCSTNVIHQVDMLLRKITGQLVQKYKGKEYCKNHREVEFRRANCIRKTILQRLKEGTLALPSNIVANIENGTMENVLQELNELLFYQFKEIDIH